MFNVKRNDDGELWLNTNNGNPDNVWNADNRFVFRRRKSFYFSPVFAGEFCFTSCPFQPPSILPISSIFTDRAQYLLLSMDLVSQRIWSKTFSVSNFLMAILTQGSFSSLERKLAIEIASILSTNKVSILWPRECLCNLGRIW